MRANLRVECYLLAKEILLADGDCSVSSKCQLSRRRLAACRIEYLISLAPLDCSCKLNQILISCLYQIRMLFVRLMEENQTAISWKSKI